MNARKSIALFIVFSLLGMNAMQAGQPLGTAKARGDYRSYSQAQQSGSRARPAYRYSAPIVRSTPAIRAEQAPVVAQAPSDARRYSVAPSTDEKAVTSSKAPTPCPSASSVTSSGRRYSGNSGRTSKPAWSLQKTDPGKYSN